VRHGSGPSPKSARRQEDARPRPPDDRVAGRVRAPPAQADDTSSPAPTRAQPLKTSRVLHNPTEPRADPDRERPTLSGTRAQRTRRGATLWRRRVARRGQRARDERTFGRRRRPLRRRGVHDRATRRGGGLGGPPRRGVASGDRGRHGVTRWPAPARRDGVAGRGRRVRRPTPRPTPQVHRALARRRVSWPYGSSTHGPVPGGAGSAAGPTPATASRGRDARGPGRSTAPHEDLRGTRWSTRTVSFDPLEAP